MATTMYLVTSSIGSTPSANASLVTATAVCCRHSRLRYTVSLVPHVLLSLLTVYTPASFGSRRVAVTGLPVTASISAPTTVVLLDRPRTSDSSKARSIVVTCAGRILSGTLANPRLRAQPFRKLSPLRSTPWYCRSKFREARRNPGVAACTRRPFEPILGASQVAHPRVIGPKRELQPLPSPS